MVGRVSNGRLLLPVTICLPGQPDLSIEFVVDTGFTEYLSLPKAAIAAMGFPLIHLRSASLADGSTVVLAVHQARIRWNGVERDIQVVATGQRPLLGTSLLDAHEMTAQFKDGGTLIVNPLP